MVSGCESRSAGPAEAAGPGRQVPEAKKKNGLERPFGELLKGAPSLGRGPGGPEPRRGEISKVRPPCPDAGCDPWRALGRAGEAPPDAVEEKSPRGRHAGAHADELVEPLACSLAVPLSRVAPSISPAERPADASLLAPVVAQLVRRLSWGGDGRRGVARIEVGAGSLAGATLLVTAEGGEVRVEVDLPPGGTAEAWANRLATALEARGVRVAGIHLR